MMRWEDGHVRVAHPRERWGADETSKVIIHCRWEDLKGSSSTLGPEKAKLAASYVAAKRQFNMSAAYDLVERWIDKAKLDVVVDVVVGLGSVTPRLVLPHPAFDDEEKDGPGGSELRNALPFAFANYLSRRLGTPVDEEIVQKARIGRTKLKTFMRFLCQPSFEGDVRPNEPYIIVDDVMTTGGTAAALRSYIRRKGGTVALATALAHKDGRDQLMGVADQTLDVLLSAYGPNLDRFWLETLGHDLRCLTQSEADFLVQWATQQRSAGAAAGDELLQLLRGRIDAAAATGR